MGEEATDVAMCLSGGGKRAALFALGAVWAVHDSGATHRLGSISSVSGSGLLNAYLALTGTLEGEQECAPDLRRFQHELSSHYHRFRLLSFFIVASLIILFLLQQLVRDALNSELFSSGWEVVSLAIVATIYMAPLGLVFTWLIRGSMQKYLVWRSFSRVQGFPWYRPLCFPQVSEVGKRRIRHIWHATELGTGNPFAFHAGGVTGVEETYTARDISLRKAVMASMAFPGVFRPESLPYTEPYHKNAFRRLVLSRAQALRLADGGLFNNLACAAIPGFPPEPKWVDDGAPLVDPDLVMIVDAEGRADTDDDYRSSSARTGVSRFRRNLRARTPLPVLMALYRNHHRTLREVAMTMEDLHLSTQAEIDQDESEVERAFARGTIYITLRETPLAYAKRLCEWAVGTSLERAQEAALYLGRIADVDWGKIQALNACVSTDLGRVSHEEAERLVAHGYVSTAVGISVHLNTRLPVAELTKVLSPVRTMEPSG